MKMPTLRVGISCPHFREGDVWENQIRRYCDRQNLYVIWILGPFEGEVKQKAGPM